jgi:hypothetical protein
MKRFLPFIFILFIFNGCKKDTAPNNVPDTPPGGGGTQIPAPEPVNTNIVGFLNDDNDQDIAGASQIVIGNTGYYTSPNGTFSTGNINVDKYISKADLNVNGSNHFYSGKTFPILPSMYSYVNFKAPRRIKIGSVTNTTGGTLAIQGGGSVSFGINSLYEAPYGIYPGFFGPSLTGDVYANAMEPGSNNFAASLPCYAMADLKQKRWFLKSYGTVNLGAVSVNSFRTMGLYNNSMATLKLPVPASMIANAPDSVEKWFLKDGLWEKAGFAKKVNNVYEAKIDRIAYWNFAAPVNGIYKTFHVKTDSGANVINATVRIKNSNAVLAEGQTNTDGKAICFVPANEDLTVEILNTWIPGNTVISVTQVSSANTAPDVDVIVKASNPFVYTFRENATACNGTGITNGFVTVNIPNSLRRECYIPVTNGKYNSSILASQFNHIVLLKVKNLATNEAGVDTAVVTSGGVQSSYNLNTCIPATNLFMNYSIDNVNYSILGDMSNPFSPSLNAYPSSASNNTLISTSNNSGLGLQFQTNGTGVGTYTGSGISNLFVNGVYHNYNFNKPMLIIFTRYDLVNNGFIIGKADFYYYDNTNPAISHHLIADFKLRRQG